MSRPARLARLGLLLWLALSTWQCRDASGLVSPGMGAGPAPPAHYVSDVPFHPQKAYQCGPASLASVLNYWGDPSTPEDIARSIYRPDLKGSLGFDMWRYARSNRFEAQMERGSLTALAIHIRQREPVIALLNLGYDWFPVGHFVVVVGWDPGRSEVITYWGTERDRRMAFEDFERAWTKTQHWMLVVRPRTERPGGDPA